MEKWKLIYRTENYEMGSNFPKQLYLSDQDLSGMFISYFIPYFVIAR